MFQMSASLVRGGAKLLQGAGKRLLAAPVVPLRPQVCTTDLSNSLLLSSASLSCNFPAVLTKLFKSSSCSLTSLIQLCMVTYITRYTDIPRCSRSHLSRIRVYALPRPVALLLVLKVTYCVGHSRDCIMAPKRPRTSSTPESVPKRARHVMTLKEKLEVLDELDSGLGVAEVGRRHKCNESTIRMITYGCLTRSCVISVIKKHEKTCFI